MSATVSLSIKMHVTCPFCGKEHDLIKKTLYEGTTTANGVLLAFLKRKKPDISYECDSDTCAKEFLINEIIYV